MNLQVKNVSVTLNRTAIIQDVSLRVKDKQFVGIIGANGSGKSTLLKTIYKTIKPQRGEIMLNDVNILEASAKRVSQKLGVVGQFNELNFDLTVTQMVLLGRTPHKKMLESDTAEDYQYMEQALAMTGLSDYKERSYLSLSGGEKQRVILARTIAQQPQFLILDEPTNHLDVRYQLEILECVKELGISVLAALHDLESVAAYCDYVYAMKDGKVIAEGATNTIFIPELIEEIYQVKCQLYENPITKKIGFTYYLKEKGVYQ